jgi:hypothetical protein
MPLHNDTDTDLYLASGTTQLLRPWNDPAWTPTVYKYDSSSFYNWEQDNLPLYDLEERTDFNWEQHGYPTSSVTGMMLNVSDSGADYKLTFPTVNEAIQALPQTLRFPVIIEVAASGHLGSIDIKDIQFEENGGLEIINRGFAKIFNGSGTASASVENFSDASSILTISSMDLSGTCSSTSSLSVSTNINTGRDTTFWAQHHRLFMSVPEWWKAADAVGSLSATNGITAVLTNDIQNTFTTATPYEFTAPLAKTYTTDAALDRVVRHGSDDSIVSRAPMGDGGVNVRVVGGVYGNSVSSICVTNCNGPVYIRGFCVDGADATNNTPNTHDISIGFDIKESDVTVENCVVTRCKDAGLQATNSRVVLSRGFTAYRNYEKTATDVRNINNDTPGLRAINSEITMRATTEENRGLPVDCPFIFAHNVRGIELINSRLTTPFPGREVTIPSTEGGADLAWAVASNSKSGVLNLVLQSFTNVKDGILARNSVIDFNQRIATFQNGVGISLDNSEAILAEFSSDHNADEGLLAHNSVIQYNPNLVDAENTTLGACRNSPFGSQFRFVDNGQHIVLNSSKMIPTYSDHMPIKYGRFHLLRNHKVKSWDMDGTTAKSTLPAVVVTEGSELELIHPRIELHGWSNASVDGGDSGKGSLYEASSSIKGSALRVTNDSSVKVVGSNAGQTLIIGPASYTQQRKNAGVYAGNNSTVEFNGPTVISQFGVDVLAENNSVMNFLPHNKDGILDASGFDLSSSVNHTMVDLHSTRACLVANKNSIINMKDLGDYHEHWATDGNLLDTSSPSPQGGSYYDYLVLSGALEIADYNPNDNDETSSLKFAGHLQFYPNPPVSYEVTDGTGSLSSTYNVTGESASYLYDYSDDDSYVGLVPSSTLITGNNAFATVAKYTMGGTCVKAVGGSKVNAKNVYFPTGWNNQQTSGAVYDLSAGENCNRLYIWNIADDSELHASYLSVSTSFPADAEYWGPSAVWASSTGTPVSGAPSSTPDTSTLSVLDSFGIGHTHGAPTGFYGKATSENRGPFRLYFSPMGPAKWLGFTRGGGDTEVFQGSSGRPIDHTPSALILGEPYQLLAQGYNPPYDVSCVDPTVLSGIYSEVETLFSGALASNSWVDASAFYYVSSVLDPSYRNRVWLDDSAMNTFANAKNATLGTSGRLKLVNYYRAIIKNATDEVGEGHAGDFGLTSGQRNGHGLGFKSANIFDLDRDN